MKIKKIKNSDDAVVGIIVAVLLIGLMLSVVSIVQTVFVPNWMEQIEADHMEEVSTQFSQLKFAIDIQSVLNITDVPVSVPITLGSNNLPFLSSAKAYGFLEIIENEITVNITNNESTTNSSSLGIIKYSSSNTYYLNQEYIYESGSLITSQDDGDIMSVQPIFKPTSHDAGTVTNINFILVDIVGVGDKLAVGGYGNFPIQVEFSGSTNYTIYNVSYINITSPNFESWRTFMNSTLTSINADFNGLIWGNTGNFTIEGPEVHGVYNMISIEFLDPIVNIEVTKIVIDAQIAPGWIEN